MSYLIDTCVISELVAKSPNPKVVTWIDSIDDAQAFLSVITIGEIQKGIAKLPESHRRDTLQAWLNNELMTRFHGKTLLIDVNVMISWGYLVASLGKRGRSVPAIDSLIAASASLHNMKLVTRNERDFEHTGLTIVNPWR
ncbi:MAG: type II toxin-antitoxin system VapC family toxin [Chloroflexi bacterium]|nr:type II toxin-antitoxin system VapC family toxin [Chloroflexota bacterium]